MAQARSETQAGSFRSAAERALMARISRYFTVAIRSLSEEDRAVALSASDDVLALIETLARKPAQASP